MTYRWPRWTLIVLQAFVALTALDGALFVVPTLPRDWIKFGPFTDFTVPAAALALFVGGSAIAALAALILRPGVAGLANMSAGIVIIIFEMVEVAVVGLAIVDYGVDQPVAWLQIVYIVVGIVEVALGYTLWRATEAAHERGTVS